MTEELEKDFQTLCRIVADVYRVPVERIPTKFRANGIARARIAAAAIWSETNTIRDTISRLHYASTAAVSVARARFQKDLHGSGVDQARAHEVIRRVMAEIPEVLGVYTENPNP